MKFLNHIINFKFYFFLKTSNHERFVGDNGKATTKVPFYEVDSKVLKTLRNCSLGKGNNYDFTKNSEHVSAPNSYNPKNLWISANLNHSFSFGVVWEMAPQNSVLFVSKSSGVKPGPATTINDCQKEVRQSVSELKQGDPIMKTWKLALENTTSIHLFSLQKHFQLEIQKHSWHKIYYVERKFE